MHPRASKPSNDIKLQPKLVLIHWPGNDEKLSWLEWWMWVNNTLKVVTRRPIISGSVGIRRYPNLPAECSRVVERGTRTRSMYRPSNRIHGTVQVFSDWFPLFVFPLTFPTTTESFKSLQLDSTLYWSVLCVKFATDHCIFKWNVLAYPCMQSCVFTYVCDNILHP